MKKILLPTDFSDNAANAFRYAQALADDLGASIKVVHYAHPNFDPDSPYVHTSLDEFWRSKKKQLRNFIEAATAPDVEGGIVAQMVDQEVMLGFAAEDIIKLSKEEDYDLIVMSTTGSSTVIEKIFGSVSSQVAQKARCPVLFIPPGISFQNIDNILYASNYESADDHLLKKIGEFAATFMANIHLVHVNETSKKGDYQFEELILEQLFVKKTKNLEFRMITVQSDTAWNGLNDYARQNSVDLIVLATTQRNFWNRLMHKSVTKKMVLGAHLPIMVLPI